MVVATVPGCAALGSSGGQPPRLAVNVGVGVWVIVHVMRWNGKRYFRAPLRCVVWVGCGVGSRVVLTSGD